MKNSPSKLAFAAGISLALAFTFSCSSSDGGGGDPNSGGCGVAQIPNSNLPRSSTSHDPHEACKNIVFNASTHFCYDGIVYDKCNGMGYNPSTHICQGTAAYPAVCGAWEQAYNPLEEGCCGGSIFELSYQRCHKYEDGEDGYVENKCGESWYSMYSNSCCTRSGIVNCPSGTVINGELMTDKGGRTYKTVVIGEQTWMAENLDYDVPCNDTDICYEYDYNNCAKYGRLYNWETAMKVCPDGWHLPSWAEWGILKEAAGGWESLMSRRGGGEYNGTDAYGFSGLPGGLVWDRFFTAIGVYGEWWSTDYCDYDDDINCMRKFFLSVRCLKD